VNSQLTFDGREVRHPPREPVETRLYVVLGEDAEGVFEYLGTFRASSPRGARTEARATTLVPWASMVAVAERNWSVGR
jgi:hypothetical protein